MRDTSLPSPDVGATGHHLRRVAAIAISEIQVGASQRASGYHPKAAKLKAFFVACAAAVDTVSPEPEEEEE